MFVDVDPITKVIRGVYGCAQPGYAEKEVPDDDPGVIAFLEGRTPPRRLSTYRIVRRLEAAGLLAPANALLESNVVFKWRFTTAPDIAVDDPDLVAGLKAIGADVDVVLAAE